jgi:hypothetical protein
MAPSHVAILFMAEALSYAVLSVVLGYVLAQGVAFLFAGTGLLRGITVNYSSLSGVLAMAMVMAVVLLSSIYPARVASSIAIPDVETSWKLSRPQGNRLIAQLPFLLKFREVPGAAGFLFEYVRVHQEISHGVFSVDDLNLWSGREQDPAFGPLEIRPEVSMDFTAWLAPFDLGIMQEVHILFHPSENQPGYARVRLVILRRSGENQTWWRLNQRFVNRIRKQLLVWRSLDPDSRASFGLQGPEVRNPSSAQALETTHDTA